MNGATASLAVSDGQRARVQAPMLAPSGPERGVPQPGPTGAMHRSLGNQTVMRLAAGEGGAPSRTAPGAASSSTAKLAPGRNFQWHRRGREFYVTVSRAWLLGRDVSPDDAAIPVAVAAEMASTIGEVAPWVDLPKLQKEIGSLTLADKLAQLPETFTIKMSEWLAAFVGNPPGEQIVVQPSAGGATVFVDTGLVRKHAPAEAPAKFSDPALSALLFAAVEAALGQTMGADREAGFRTTLYRDWEWELPLALDKYGQSIAFHLDADDLETLFGADWAPKANRKAAKEAGRVKGHTISLPENLREDWPQIMAILKELVGAPTTPKQTDRGLAISEKEALLLLKIAKSPLRQQIVDRIRNAQSGKANSDLGDALEAIIEEQELRAARKRLGLDDPGVGGEKPVLKRPVHGNIVLTGGRPVPRKEAVFTFEVTDDVDALRAPLIQIQWVVYPKDRPKFVFDAELNTYSPLRGQGPINDQLFEVTFPVAGTYVVEALVSHNFFLPAHFSTELKILTEEQEVNLQEKGPLSGFAAPKGAKTDKHDFDVGGFTSAVTDYEEGTVTRGKLDPAFKAGTLADRLKSIDAEIARVEKLCEQFRTPSNEHGAAVLHWAEDYLKELRSGRSAVEVSATDTQVVPCTGVYVSRSKKAPSKPLNLVCLQKRTADGYRVILHDLSQVYEAENYRFEVDNATAEGAYEEVFVEAAEAYPDGTLSIAFQGWSEKTQKPTDSYVKYRKVTDTVLKDVKTNVFDPAVNIAVNIAAAVMMVIPGLQAAGFALAIIWNTSQTLLELEEKAAKGTLKDKDLVYAGASFALDLLPVVGRSARVVSMGRKAYYAIELTQFAGQVLLVSLQGAEQIEKLRNGVISKLANLNERIVELERVNPSDPELDALRVQQDKLIREGQDAVIEVYGSIVAQQGLMMVGGALIQQAAIKKFGARLGELETQGRFAHREGESPHYDYDERRIVADRATMTQAEFESVERVARLAERLEGAVPDPSTRARVVESLGDGSVEIVVGGTKTHLESDAGRKVLHVADDAHADDILNAARGAPRAEAAPRRQTPRLEAKASLPPQAAIPTPAAAPNHQVARRRNRAPPTSHRSLDSTATRPASWSTRLVPPRPGSYTSSSATNPCAQSSRRPPRATWANTPRASESPGRRLFRIRVPPRVWRACGRANTRAWAAKWPLIRSPTSSRGSRRDAWRSSCGRLPTQPARIRDSSAIGWWIWPPTSTSSDSSASTAPLCTRSSGARRHFGPCWRSSAVWTPMRLRCWWTRSAPRAAPRASSRRSASMFRPAGPTAPRARSQPTRPTPRGSGISRGPRSSPRTIAARLKTA